MLDKYLRREDERGLLEKKMGDQGRLPPGQSASIKWPVLHEGEVPAFDPKTWDLRIGGAVETPLTLSWEVLQSLPKAEVRSDFHCVTRWSTFDNLWRGVLFREVVKQVRPTAEAAFVMVLGHLGRDPRGYSTNVPLADLDRPEVLLAESNRGQAIDPEHGGPLRLVVPHLYAWKSCKWIRGLVFMAKDEPGYWERRGYHRRGDPFAEERFS